MRRPFVFALFALASLPLLACAPGGGHGAASQPAVAFPTRAEVAQIPARAPRPEAFPTGDVLADSWTFETPPAAANAAYDDSSPWADLLRPRVAAHAATAALSAPLRCAALEIARFHRAHHGLPVESLRRFMIARCGGTTPEAAPSAWWVDAAPVVTDAALIDKARGALGRHLDEQLGKGHVLVGMGVARDAHGVSLVTLVAPDDARLDPGPRRVDASRRITLRGEARGDFAQVMALVNHGRYGVDSCDADPTVKAPRFAVTCAVAPEDPFAWVEILGRKKGLFLEHAVAEVLVEAADESAIQYEARHYGDPQPVTTPDAFRAALLAGVNRVRGTARLPPLVLATKQSAENARLVGTLLDTLGGDAASVDRAALGLLAGWDVEGTIRNGSFLLASLAPTRDATAWLDAALELPLGRRTLLDPSARLIAVGPAVPQGANALGAAVTTYALFDSPNHAPEEARFVERVAEARIARGLPAPVRVAGFEEMAAAAARVHRQGEASTDALDDILQAAVSRTGTAVRGVVYETNDIDHVDVPDDLLTPGPLHMIVGITHHRAPGAAWGQYVVFVVLVGGDAVSPLREARASTTTSG